jgi:hypothetical protein
MRSISPLFRAPSVGAAHPVEGEPGHGSLALFESSKEGIVSCTCIG